MRLAGEHPQAEGAQAVVESRTVVAREVVVVVHLVDAGVLQGVALQVQRLRARENGSENRPDRPTAVGPVFAPATRSGPAAPLHAERRRPAAHRGAAATANKLGFALQLCVLRYPGRLLAPGEFIPPAVVDFIGRQLDLDGYELADYAVRSETRHEHLAELRRLYGFRSFSDHAARELGDRLREEAPLARSNEDLARRFVDACRQTRTILPTTTTIERLCADALVDAERRIETRIAERVPPGLRRGLENLLRETVDANVTRFVWLRQFEPGTNFADANRLLDRLEYLQRLDFSEGLFHDVPAHRITRLRRQGERVGVGDGPTLRPAAMASI